MEITVGIDAVISAIPPAFPSDIVFMLVHSTLDAIERFLPFGPPASLIVFHQPFGAIIIGLDSPGPSQVGVAGRVLPTEPHDLLLYGLSESFTLQSVAVNPQECILCWPVTLS